MNLRSHLDTGRITLVHLDPAEMSPGEFIAQIRNSVEENRAGTIVIDSLNGFLQAMPANNSWGCICPSC